MTCLSDVGGGRCIFTQKEAEIKSVKLKTTLPVCSYNLQNESDTTTGIIIRPGVMETEVTYSTDSMLEKEVERRRRRRKRRRSDDADDADASSRWTPAPRMPEQSNDYRVVVFGAGGVGKSSLVLRFVKGTFRDTYIPTVEDTYRQVISCDKSVCTLQITDTTGSHQFPAMQRLSISKGHAFILVFSVTSRQSLEELKPIYQQVLSIKGSVDSIPVMLVGNKSDETAQREVDTKAGEAQAAAWKCAFMETSAKTNSNVKELFQELLALEKKRDMSLSIDGKRSGKQKRADKLKGKCSIM
ncbi:hypothetical protein F2P81_005113 [Scophthalmus maximus]|uniref:Uncharacterized protein n=2 Tax=Scophthalmus maximus TaxID=52904 RepID=A0A6A4TFE5_SCOMX|nr:hypothetical protein F2P81_005113 [Scophthalmus maximus]